MRERQLHGTQDRGHKRTDRPMIQAAVDHALRLYIDYPLTTQLPHSTVSLLKVLGFPSFRQPSLMNSDLLPIPWAP